MSIYKDWQPNSIVDKDDAERWDGMISPSQLRDEVMLWLNGQDVSGAQPDLILSDMVDGKYWKRLPYTVQYNTTNVTDFLVQNDLYIVQDKSETGDRYPSFYALDDTQIRNLSNASAGDISIFDCKTRWSPTETLNSAIQNIMQFVYDIRQYMIDSFSALMPSSNPTWNQVLTVMETYGISFTLYTGNPFYKSIVAGETENAEVSRVTIESYQRVLNTAGTSWINSSRTITQSDKNSPAENGKIDIPASELRRHCTNNGMLHVRYLPYYMRVQGNNRLTIPWLMRFTTRGKVGIGASANYNFHDTYVLREEFDKYIMGSPVTITREINASKIIQLSVNPDQTIKLNGSPIRNLMTSFTYPDMVNKTTRYNVDNFKEALDGGTTAIQNMMYANRTTEELRVPYEGTTNNENATGRPISWQVANGRIPPDAFQPYGYELNPLYSYHAGGYIYTNGIWSIFHQGWEMDWVQFFDYYFPGIFPTSMSRTDKVNMIKTEIKPRSFIEYVNVTSQALGNINQVNNPNQGGWKGWKPDGFRQCLVINQGDRLTRVGNLVFTSLEDAGLGFLDWTSNAYQTWNTGWMAPLTNFNGYNNIGIGNIDSEGYTYISHCTWNWGNAHRNYSRYDMRAGNSPILWRVTFQWGLREFVVNITGGVTQASVQAEIQSLQSQIDELKGQ